MLAFEEHFVCFNFMKLLVENLKTFVEINLFVLNLVQTSGPVTA